MADQVREERTGGVVKESRRPCIIHRLPEKAVARIIKVRLREGWCSEAIAAYLKQQENIKAGTESIYRVLKGSNLITRTYRPGRQPTYIRFQDLHADTLW